MKTQCSQPEPRAKKTNQGHPEALFSFLTLTIIENCLTSLMFFCSNLCSFDSFTGMFLVENSVLLPGDAGALPMVQLCSTPGSAPSSSWCTTTAATATVTVTVTVSFTVIVFLCLPSHHGHHRHLSFLLLFSLCLSSLLISLLFRSFSLFSLLFLIVLLLVLLLPPTAIVPGLKSSGEGVGQSPLRRFGKRGSPNRISPD